ncbi:DUF2569 family protein [Laribacter hongkongensis]|uniref:DUF2569 family protein n=1 Tax=Laribacter hongkongensis TaxID=168471 RepID=UPI001EFEB2A4|nr:DUF2569 family protein [Laribacter hongkongensis]MCG9078910.1 DUF2569 domain-containing protein [Laribacter hongkongensis]
MAQNNELKGVGGWLAFLVISFMLRPLFAVSTLHLNLSDATKKYPELLLSKKWELYSNITWGHTWIYALLSIYTGYLLLKVHKWSSVKIAISMLWILLITPQIIDTLVAAFIFGNVDDSSLQLLIQQTISTSIGATLWTAYLIRSKRVRNTYVRDDYSYIEVIPASESLGHNQQNSEMIVQRQTLTDSLKSIALISTAIAYPLGAIATFGKLTFFDGVEYTWWNWMIILPLNMMLSSAWPVYWLIIKPVRMLFLN